MTVQERVIAIINNVGKPMSTRMLADKMRLPPNRISGTVSRMYSYGYLKVAEDRRRGTMHEHFYLPSGKPLTERP